jgi:hypothetical protein
LTTLQPIKVLADPLKYTPKDAVRMNDGGCDPAGRYFAGSMGYDDHQKERKGELWRSVGRQDIVTENTDSMGVELILREGKPKSWMGLVSPMVLDGHQTVNSCV